MPFVCEAGNVQAGQQLPSNVEIAQRLDTVKPGEDVPREKLSETGREVRLQQEVEVTSAGMILTASCTCS
jgi:hypothetical protein